MKTKQYRNRTIRHLACLATMGVVAAPIGALAQTTWASDQNPGSSSSSQQQSWPTTQQQPQTWPSSQPSQQQPSWPGSQQQQTWPSSQQQQQQWQTTTSEQVKVTRASTQLGTDVIASDGKKVGDIVDFYFDVGSTSRLAYVVIMSGGFLDVGGDRRAVPASAVTLSNGSARINVPSDRFLDVPVLPQNRERFISDPQNRQRISQFFGHISATAGISDPNQPGAMTGMESSQGMRLVSFNALRSTEAYSQQETRLGYFADAWINLNDNRAPYVEITPTYQPFRTNNDRRYAVPTTKLSQRGEYGTYTLNVTMDELNQAQPVSETEGVRLLSEGRSGNTVLRVTLPQR